MLFVRQLKDKHHSMMYLTMHLTLVGLSVIPSSLLTVRNTWLFDSTLVVFPLHRSSC